MIYQIILEYLIFTVQNVMLISSIPRNSKKKEKF